MIMTSEREYRKLGEAIAAGAAKPKLPLPSEGVGVTTEAGEKFWMSDEGALTQEQPTWGEQLGAWGKELWRVLPISPYYWKTPEEKAFIQKRDVLESWAELMKMEEPRLWAEEQLRAERPKGEVTMRAYQPSEGAVPLPRMPTPDIGAEFTPGEKLVGEWGTFIAATGWIPAPAVGWAATKVLPTPAKIAARTALAPLVGVEKVITAPFKAVGLTLKGLEKVFTEAQIRRLTAEELAATGKFEALTKAVLNRNTLRDQLAGITARGGSGAKVRPKLVAAEAEIKPLTQSARVEVRKLLKETKVPVRAAPPPEVAGVTPKTVAERPLEALPTIEEIVAANYDLNIAATMGSRLANAPLIGRLVSGVNPMLAAKTVEERGVIAWKQLLDIADSNAAIRLTKVWQTKTPFAIERRVSITPKGIRVKTGTLNVTNVKPKEAKHISDINAIAEFPDRYFLSEAQRTELNLLDEILIKQLALENAAGVKVAEIALKPGQRYFPRFVGAIQGIVKEVRTGIKRRVGAKQAFQRGRWYEEVHQGIRAGKDYGVDIRGAVEGRLRAGNRAIADRRLADFLKKPEFKGRIPEGWRAPIVGKEGIIQVSGLEGRLFPVDTAEVVNKMITQEITTSNILGQLMRVNALARMGQTAIDTGFTLIQGLLLLSNRPDVWGKAFGISLATLKNPRYAARWAQSHTNTLLRMANSGGAPFMSSEFTEAARAGGLLGEVPVAGAVFKRFGSAFEIYLDVSRTYMFEALEHKAVTAIERTALVNFVDNMVGISSMRRLGMSALGRQLMTNALYAPRYYQAFVGLTADAFQGGLRGELARKSLAKFMVAIPTFMAAVAMIFEQPERIIPTKEKPIPTMYDPRTPEFMSVEIGGVHMGLGGVYIAAYRLLGSLAQATEDDPSRFLSVDPHVNPVLRYFYGRMAPVASAVVDVVTGHNYLGERLDTPADYSREVIDKTFPFWLAGTLTDVPKAGWKKAVAEWWGLRAWQIQYWEQARDMAEELIPQIPDEMIMDWQRKLIADGRKLTYDDLNNGQRAWLLENYQEYREAQETAWEDRKRKGTDIEVVDTKIMELLTDSYHSDLSQVAESVFAGTAAVADYNAQSEYLRRIRQGEFQYRALFEQFGDPEDWERQERWLAENRTVEDTAYEDYMELRGNPPTTDGKPDWEKWRVQLDAFLANQTPEVQAYIERRRQTRFNSLPEPAKKLEQLIYQCEEGLNAYYDQPEGKARSDFRRFNPEIDAKLFILGRTTRVMTASATVVVRKLQTQFGLPIVEVPLAEPVKATDEARRLRKPTLR